LERLHEARSQLWRLVALAGDVVDPSYGLTSVLDFAPELVTATMGETVSDLDSARLLSAGHRVATLLTETSRRLPEETRAMFPDAMVRYVTVDLESLQTLKCLLWAGVLWPAGHDISVSSRSRRSLKMRWRPTCPLAAASSRWRARVGRNSMVVWKKVQPSQMDSKWQSRPTGRAQ
jgi:hypothetical protein